MITVERQEKQRGSQSCEVEAAGAGMSQVRSPRERARDSTWLIGPMGARVSDRS